MDENKPLIQAQKSHKKQCTSTRTYVMIYVFLTCCSMHLCGLAQPQYFYHYLKQEYDFNDTNVVSETENKTYENKNCSDNSSTTSDNEIQGLASLWSWYVSLAEYGVALPVILLIGPMIDRFGRKPILLWNTIGISISYVLKTLAVYRNMPLHYYVFASGVEGASGALLGFNLINHAILADITDTGKDRSFSMTVYDALLGIGAMCSNIGTGYAIQLLGYTFPFVISTGLLLIVPIFIAITLKDPWKPPQEKYKLKVSNVCREMFSLCYKNKRKRKNLCRFLLYFLLVFMAVLPFMSLTSIRTLFLLGPPFCWTSEHIGWYGAGCDFMKYILGTSLLKILHSMCVRLKDEMIVVMGQCFSAAYLVLLGFAHSDWMIYEAAVAEIPRIVVLPLLKAIMSRMVSSGQQGLLFSNIYSIETICELAAATAFNNLYKETVSIYKGLTFFVMASFPVFGGILMLCMNCARSPEVISVSVIENTEIQSNGKGEIKCEKGEIDSRI